MKGKLLSGFDIVGQLVVAKEIRLERQRQLRRRGVNSLWGGPTPAMRRKAMAFMSLWQQRVRCHPVAELNRKINRRAAEIRKQRITQKAQAQARS